MKKLLLMLTVFLNGEFFYAQISDTAMTFTKVVFVDSTLKSPELYERAREWFALTYRSSKEVLQVEDKDNFKLIGKGAFKYISDIYYGSEGTKGWVYYTITVQVKDGKYKYELSNFIHEGNVVNPAGYFSFGLITSAQECPSPISYSTQNWRNKVWNDIKMNVNRDAYLTINSLTGSMNKPATKKSDDW
jgi:hypothetical protein